MKYVHPFVFALCTIIPMEPDEVIQNVSKMWRISNCSTPGAITSSIVIADIWVEKQDFSVPILAFTITIPIPSTVITVSELVVVHFQRIAGVKNRKVWFFVIELRKQCNSIHFVVLTRCWERDPVPFARRCWWFRPTTQTSFTQTNRKRFTTNWRKRVTFLTRKRTWVVTWKLLSPVSLGQIFLADSEWWVHTTSLHHPKKQQNVALGENQNDSVREI